MATGGLVALTLALGGAGCGSSSSSKGQFAAAQWRTGLIAWHQRMAAALNGMSVLFSQPGPVTKIEGGDRKTGARLAAYTRTLGSCSVLLKRIGPAPESLTESGLAANQACNSLEQGARLVTAGVRALQRGLGAALLDSSVDPLGAGQDEMDTAIHALDLAAPS